MICLAKWSTLACWLLGVTKSCVAYNIYPYISNINVHKDYIRSSYICRFLGSNSRNSEKYNFHCKPRIQHLLGNTLVILMQVILKYHLIRLYIKTILYSICLEYTFLFSQRVHQSCIPAICHLLCKHINQ